MIWFLDRSRSWNPCRHTLGLPALQKGIPPRLTVKLGNDRKFKSEKSLSALSFHSSVYVHIGIQTKLGTSLALKYTLYHVKLKYMNLWVMKLGILLHEEKSLSEFGESDLDLNFKVTQVKLCISYHWSIPWQVLKLES